ncbi:hypothetical protein B0T26DRAFT_299509 [Lasiosphaeria miniovina]|uniref:Uncharacterized protein n=1 Tax=Lasiosphaeria miniovina TaxID=1954250 RepID=A0AA40AKP1_9PEZI|nr:uncharacterized protein B0T26DRAFT_299509 [Lasiosphaeria miniovina]KAK0717584.1 hypothetical protein B0T26DRAFT_299509 [Lasiosphaeria miniovina]
MHPQMDFNIALLKVANTQQYLRQKAQQVRAFPRPIPSIAFLFMVISATLGYQWSVPCAISFFAALVLRSAAEHFESLAREQLGLLWVEPGTKSQATAALTAFSPASQPEPCGCLGCCLYRQFLSFAAANLDHSLELCSIGSEEIFVDAPSEAYPRNLDNGILGICDSRSEKEFVAADSTTHPPLALNSTEAQQGGEEGTNERTVSGEATEATSMENSPRPLEEQPEPERMEMDVRERPSSPTVIVPPSQHPTPPTLIFEPFTPDSLSSSVLESIEVITSPLLDQLAPLPSIDGIIRRSLFDELNSADSSEDEDLDFHFN